MLSHLLLSLAVAAALIQVAVFGTTIYLHRCATHRALILHPAVEWTFKMALWLTTGQCTKEWVAVHRKHHAFTDEEGDPQYRRLQPGEVGQPLGDTPEQPPVDGSAQREGGGHAPSIARTPRRHLRVHP